MFWGLNLKPNRKYSQTTTKSFHISQAALDTGDTAQDGPNKIYITYEKQKLLICTLRKDTCEQVMLDFNFAEGDEISFQCVGSGNVSLSGYLIDDDSDEYCDEELDDELEMKTAQQDLRNELNKKSKIKNTANEVAIGKGKSSATIGELDEEDSDSDSDDSDFNESELKSDDEGGSDEEIEEDEDDEDDDDDEAEAEEDESEEEVEQPKAKQAKLEKPQKVHQNGVAKANDATEKKGKKNKKDKKVEKQAEVPIKQKETPKATVGERTITGGVKIEDVRVGTGTEAKVGKRAQVYYEGRLKTNNKVFDSLKQGAGFKFSVGRGEVIKGWDVGVVGMKVGGKRRITCPAHMAYGARGSPPTIPPNSTLVFEVELKSVQ